MTMTNLPRNPEWYAEHGVNPPPALLPFFVYGTLRPGCGNTWAWSELGDARHDGNAVKIGHRLTTNGGFPYAVPAASAQTVGTLIYPRDDAHAIVLDNMDRLESEGRMYRRIETAVLADGIPTMCWMYEGLGEFCRQLPDAPMDQFGRYDWKAGS